MRSNKTHLFPDYPQEDKLLYVLFVVHAPAAMVLFFLFLFFPLTFAFMLTAVAALYKPGCAVRAVDTSSV